MRIFPFARFTFNSPLTHQEVLDVLVECVGKPKLSFLKKDTGKPYLGSVYKSRFSIYRNINYRSSFNPMISGTIQPLPNGTLVKIRLALHPIVLIFWGIWMCFALFALLTSLYQIWETESSDMLGFSLLFVAFGYGIASIGFNVEARKIEQFFTKSLKISTLGR